MQLLEGVDECQVLPLQLGERRRAVFFGSGIDKGLSDALLVWPPPAGEATMNVHYTVELGNEEREVLRELCRSGNPRARKVKRALILLSAERGETHEQIEAIGFHMALRLLRRGDRIMGHDNLNDYYDVARVRLHDEQPGFSAVRRPW